MKQACTLTNFKSLKQKVESNTIITNQKSFSNTKFIYDTESEDFSLHSDGVDEHQPPPKQPRGSIPRDENIFDDEEVMSPPVVAQDTSLKKRMVDLELYKLGIQAKIKDGVARTRGSMLQMKHV